MRRVAQPGSSLDVEDGILRLEVGKAFFAGKATILWVAHGAKGSDGFVLAHTFRMRRTRQKRQNRQKAGRDAYNGGLLGLLTPVRIFIWVSEALRPARGNEMEPLRIPGFPPMALTRLAASISGVFRGNGEGAAFGAVFSKKGPFSAFKRRNGNPSTGNGFRLETKGPAHDRAGNFVPRTGFEPVLPD